MEDYVLQINMYKPCNGKAKSEEEKVIRKKAVAKLHKVVKAYMTDERKRALIKDILNSE